MRKASCFCDSDWRRAAGQRRAGDDAHSARRSAGGQRRRGRASGAEEPGRDASRSSAEEEVTSEDAVHFADLNDPGQEASAYDAIRSIDDALSSIFGQRDAAGPRRAVIDHPPHFIFGSSDSCSAATPAQRGYGDPNGDDL